MKTLMAVSVTALMFAIVPANAGTPNLDAKSMEQRCLANKFKQYRPSYCDEPTSPKLKGPRRDKAPDFRRERDDDLFFFIPNLFGKIVDDTGRAVDRILSDIPNPLDD